MKQFAQIMYQTSPTDDGLHNLKKRYIPLIDPRIITYVFLFICKPDILKKSKQEFLKAFKFRLFLAKLSNLCVVYW